MGAGEMTEKKNHSLKSSNKILVIWKNKERNLKN